MILEESSSQVPFISKDSKVLLLGQNPGKIHLQRPAVHPFRFESVSHNLITKGAQPWAKRIVECIVINDYKWPTIMNLCNCITDDNDVSYSQVIEFGGMNVIKFIEENDINTLFCFGSRTFSFFMSLYFDYGSKEVGDLDVVNLKHPAWMTRFHSGDVDMQRDELKKIRSGIRRKNDAE